MRDEAAEQVVFGRGVNPESRTLLRSQGVISNALAALTMTRQERVHVEYAMKTTTL